MHGKTLSEALWDDVEFSTFLRHAACLQRQPQCTALSTLAALCETKGCQHSLLRPAAPEQELMKIEMLTNLRLPQSLRDIWRTSNGASLAGCVHIPSTAEVL